MQIAIEYRRVNQRFGSFRSLAFSTSGDPFPVEEKRLSRNKSHPEKIIFVELYHKNDKENEDKQRILNNFK